MIYRPLNINDFPGILGLIELCCQEISAPYDPRSIVKTYLSGSRENALQICVLDGDTYVGLLCASLNPHYTDDRVKYLVEYSWHTSPVLPSLTRAKIMLQLLHILEDFAKVNGVELMLSVSPGSTLNKYLKKHKFVPKEIVYTKDLRS